MIEKIKNVLYGNPERRRAKEIKRLRRNLKLAIERVRIMDMIPNLSRNVP